MAKIEILANRRAEMQAAQKGATAQNANRIKLTIERVKKLEAIESRRRWVADTEAASLYIAVEALRGADAATVEERRATSKSYYVRGRIGRGRKAKRVDIRIGDTDQVSLADARERASRMRLELRDGNDPRQDTPAGETAKDFWTIGQLIDHYEEDLNARGIVRVHDVIGSLRRGLKGMMDLPLHEVTRSTFLDAIGKVEENVGLPSADALRRHLTGMLSMAVNKHLLEYSVMAGYRKPKATRAEKIKREIKKQPNLRGAEEYRAFWRCSSAATSAAYRDYLRVLLLTGQRGIELAKARWADFDIASARWDVRAETRKNGEPLSVPLGSLSLEILAQQANCDGLVFPGTRGALIQSGASKRLVPVKAAMLDLCDRGDIAQHTLRRAYRTRLAEMGVSTELAETMLGHKRTDLIERYDHSDLFAERATAQEAYEAWVAEVVEHGNA